MQEYILYISNRNNNHNIHTSAVRFEQEITEIGLSLSYWDFSLSPNAPRYVEQSDYSAEPRGWISWNLWRLDFLSMFKLLFCFEGELSTFLIGEFLEDT